MASQYHEQILRLQKRSVEAAQRLKGEQPTDPPSRQRLQAEFHSEQTDSTTGGDDDRLVDSCFIGYSYPPSTTKLEDLTPMVIPDLRLETHHVGKVLIVRTIGHPRRIHSVQNAIEDRNGDVDRLAIYHGNPRFKASQILPKDTLFAIKEPFYKTTADGGYIVRVDHPSDLVLLRPTHPMIPIELSPCPNETDREAWKETGNDAYKNGNYLDAVGAYTVGISLSDFTQDPHYAEEPDLLLFSLYRNRSIANFALQRWLLVLADATRSENKAVNPQGDADLIASNIKGFFRAGSAEYFLRNYSEAKMWFTRIIKEYNPQHAGALRELKRIDLRMEEETTGNYNFEKMSKSATKEHNRLDHASFTNQVGLRLSKNRGVNDRGHTIFARADIKAGEVILVEKAFAMACKSDTGAETHSILNPNTDFASSGPQTTLLHNIIHKLLYDPQQSARFFNLWDGGYLPKCTSAFIDGGLESMFSDHVVDDVVAVDIFQAQAIIERNGFSCAITKLVDAPDVEPDPTFTSVGIWLVASYINHACDGNARRANIGDMMIIRATRDIAEGEEILMAYLGSDDDYDDLQQQLQSNWNFTCDCNICDALVNSTPESREQRGKLLEQATEFLDANRIPARPPFPTVAVIDQGEKLWREIDNTYDIQLFNGVPRLGLVALSSWLCTAYYSRMMRREGMEAAFIVLRDLGYGVTIEDDSLTIDRTHCYPDHPAMDAAMAASHIAFLEQKHNLSVQFGDLAREVWRIMHGEISGFEHVYGMRM